MRHFNLNNKAVVLCSLIGNTPSFVFEGNHLTEEITKKREQIELLLKNRNYDVPGVNVEFYHDVTDELGEHIIKVSSISCENPDIRMNSWEVRVGGTVVSIHSDGSGSMEMYCGTDWNNDKEEFMKSKHFHRKMDGKSRIVLQYDLQYDTFKATDDCGRGYLPDTTNGEQGSYSLEDVENKLLAGMEWLITHIKNTVASDIDAGLFSEPFPTPMSNPLFNRAKLYTKADGYALERIRQRSRGNYGKDGGWRLLSLGIRGPVEHQYRELMNDGFTYCEIQFPGKEVTNNSWHYDSNCVPVEVKLTKSDNVFVVDAAAADRFRDEWFKANPDAQKMTDESYNELQKVRAGTMVHINEYDGSFEKPLVLVGRILSVDELALTKLEMAE